MWLSTQDWMKPEQELRIPSNGIAAGLWRGPPFTAVLLPESAPARARVTDTRVSPRNRAADPPDPDEQTPTLTIMVNTIYGGWALLPCQQPKKHQTNNVYRSLALT